MLHLVPGALALGVYITEAFGWWPSSLIINAGTEPSYGTGALAATALLMLLGSVLAAPIAEDAIFAATCCLGCRQDGAAGDQWLTPRSLPDITCGHHG
jgi:hypothetical protein